MERAALAAERCDVLISVGTSNLVWPAAELPMHALRAGAAVIIVNPDMDGQPDGDRVIPLVGSSGEILPEVVRRAFSAQASSG
jgi:NAD-dependent deacetylase